MYVQGPRPVTHQSLDVEDMCASACRQERSSVPCLTCNLSRLLLQVIRHLSIKGSGVLSPGDVC